jgi:hypothetical protein
MNQSCKQCHSPFNTSAEELVLYEKFGVTPSDLCFYCLQKGRLAFRNASSLYHRKCDATGADIISIFSPDKPYKVYKSDYWYSDAWDALSYGLDFDFSRPFFEQLKELQLKVPRLALSSVNSVNSDYCNTAYGNKNSYLIFGGDENEDSMFGHLCMRNIRCLDLDFSNQNELSYMLGDSLQCYGCQFVFDSKNCNACAFISDCIGCNDCILCTNLVNQSYCIRNQQYTKEEYFQKKAELLNGTYSGQKSLFEEFKDLLKRRVVKYAHTVSSQDCSGDYIKNSKHCVRCFDVAESEDLTDIIFASKSKDCFNCSMLGDKSELCYQMVSNYAGFNNRFSFFVIDSSGIEYSDFILNSQNLFGCVGLRNKQYCIFNKQYSKLDFENLRAEIVRHMKKTGEWEQFLPPHLSCFGYNETTAYDYFPMSREEALAQGFQWKDTEEKLSGTATFSVSDFIGDVPDSIFQGVLACEACRRNFKIVAQELDFYRQLQLPIPRRCPDCRHALRSSLRNPRQLWDRSCAKCSVAIQSSYAPERPEVVYCEKCYLEAIY